MKLSPSRFASALAASLSLLALAAPAHAEPAMMKEHTVRPRIQAMSEDGRFSVSLGGFVQGRYTLVLRDIDLEVSRFDTPRTRLYVFGHAYSKDVRYRLMIGTQPSSLDLELYDAYVEYGVSDALRVRAGRFKIPVFREWIESARVLASVERTVLTQTLMPGREWGLLASGELFGSRVEYAAGLFNGRALDGTAGSAEAPLVAGRVAWNLMGRSIEGEVDFEDTPRTLVVGASGYATLERGSVEHASGGIEVAYRGHGLDVTTEIMAQTRGPMRAAGMYARADRYIPRIRSSFGVRGTRVVGFDAPDLTRSEVEIDGAYYPAEHDLKIAANLGLARRHDEHAWEPFLMVQAQAAF